MVADRNEVLNESQETIYGYPVKDLILFAYACRKQHITEEELHDFVTSSSAAFNFGYEELHRAAAKAMSNSFGEHDFKFNKEKKDDRT